MPDKQKKERAEKSAKADFKTLFHRKLTETHLFYEVGRIIASELEPLVLIQKVAATIAKEIHFEDISVYLVKKDMTGLDPFYFTGSLLREGEVVDPIYFDNGAPGEIAATGEPMFINDTDSYDSFLHHPDEASKPGSYMGVALKNDTRVIGVMGFGHSGKSAFRVEEFDLLRSLSHLISVGIEKADLFRKTLELSRIDELTGLFNYRVLLEKLDEEVRRQVRSGHVFSFIMIDIDDFKRINDRYGHLEGSRLIAQMGPLMNGACRTSSTDTCFRYGGEEFSILLVETDLKEAMEVAERVRKAVEEYPFTVKVAHPDENVTVSLGVSSMQFDSGKTIPELINEADIALYHSKASGKNAVTSYNSSLSMPGSLPASGQAGAHS